MAPAWTGRPPAARSFIYTAQVVDNFELYAYYTHMKKITEIPTGKYDAIRTLRHALRQAEEGEFDQVVILFSSTNESDGSNDLWAHWSDMERREVLWLNRWFNSWLNKRYFGDYHSDGDPE